MSSIIRYWIRAYSGPFGEASGCGPESGARQAVQAGGHVCRHFGWNSACGGAFAFH